MIGSQITMANNSGNGEIVRFRAQFSAILSPFPQYCCAANAEAEAPADERLAAAVTFPTDGRRKLDGGSFKAGNGDTKRVFVKDRPSRCAICRGRFG
jgi:hypothetical protein